MSSVRYFTQRSAHRLLLVSLVAHMPYRVSASDVLEARLFRNKDALLAMFDGRDLDLNEGALSRRQAL